MSKERENARDQVAIRLVLHLIGYEIGGRFSEPVKKLKKLCNPL